MRNFIRKVIFRAGWDLHRLTPSANPAVQLKRALDWVDINLVFDVGANVGQFGCGLRAGGFDGEIVSFEPLSSARAQLIRNAKADVKWVVHEQCAIGDRDGEIEMNISGNSVSSSVLPMLESHSDAAVDSAYVAQEVVPVVRLDSVAERYRRSGSNLFVKIDTQGYEWQVLDGAEETLKFAKGVLCELSLVPLYEGQRLWRDVVDRLESEGFSLWALQRGFTDPRTGRSLQVDAIFLRSEK